MKKLLLYLDQSYLSSMAKETAGLTKAENAAIGQAMRGLLDLLSGLVDQDKVLCPSSAVHEQEIGFDDRLEDCFYRILMGLSDGMSFRIYRDIEFDQTVRALRRYLNQPAEPEDGRWEHAMDCDPHQPVKRPRTYVWRRPPPEFAEDDRNRKSRIHQYRVQHPAESLPTTFAEWRKQQMLGVAKRVYVEAFNDYLARIVGIVVGTVPWAPANKNSSLQEHLDFLEVVLPPPAWRLAREYFSLMGPAAHRECLSPIPREYQFLSSLLNLIPDERYWSFFVSEQFDAIPYYDIFCSLDAGFQFHKRKRKPQPSDPYDMASLASVLPYVDIVTTDRAMKDMLRQLKLHDRYKVEVYSSRLSDVEALTKRLAALAQ